MTPAAAGNGPLRNFATLDEGIPGALLIQGTDGPLFVREPPARYGIAA